MDVIKKFYTCSPWVSYGRRAHNDLGVPYNNALRALLGLPWRCSASVMFAEARIDGFLAIMRKNPSDVPFLMSRLRGSTNNILDVITDRWDTPMLQNWLRLHTVHTES